MISRILGSRYEIIEKIGEGGMAKVYKARDNKLNRLVAVKVLKKEFADNEEIAEKFKREATAIANLSDANIVNILDVGHEDDDNIDYIIMEYVNGKTLKELIVYNGKLSYNTALTISIQIAKALECAHKNNIIHRDVKPQNILVTENGEVKVTDFGIAKSTTSATITNTTTIMGSAHYLSPEQAKGTFIDGRSDLYSLGIVLYEMVTGKLPFDGESPVTIALKHIQQTPQSPKEVNPSIPESLNNLILKAISKEPIARYENAKDMIIDLQKIKDNPDVKIVNGEGLDDGKTIIMGSVGANIVDSKNRPMSKEAFEEDEEDEEYDDDYEDDDDQIDKYRNKNTKKKKNKKLKIWILSIIFGIILIGVAVFAVTLNINKVKEVKMPNIIGMSFDEGKKELEDIGLKIKKKSVKNSEEVENSILEASKKVDEMVPEGTTIEVVISGGVEKVEVPGDFRDMDIEVVKKALQDADLTYAVTQEYSDTFDIGRVISQSIKNGTKVEKGTEVGLVVSKGKETKYVDVPNVVGYNLSDGKNKLESLKLTVEVEEKETDRNEEDGKILMQSVVDKSVQEGTPVTITVGKYVEPSTNIASLLSVGMKLDEALNILNSNGILYKISGGDPQEEDWKLYEITSFTESIKKNEKVQLTIKLIEQDNGTETVE